VTVAVATARGLVDAGHAVTVATSDALDLQARVPSGTPAEPSAAEVVRFPNLSQRLAATNIILPRGLRSWLRRRASQFDVVLVLDVYSSVSVLGSRAASRARVPYVLEALGTLPTTPERGRALPKRAFLSLWGRRTVSDAAACLYLSADERREYLAQGANPERLVPLPPPLDLPTIEPVDKAASPLVLYLGQLHPIKRIDVLIRAFSHVRQEFPDARLEVIGATSAHGEQLKALARSLSLGDAVGFPGFLAEEDKPRKLAEAHVFGLLSASEGLPVTPLEALACGTPVVLSPGCRLPEVDGVGGIVCDGTAEGAAEALMVLLRHPKRARELGDSGRRFAAAYRREVVVPELVELLERVATSSRSAA
jgi:glycosyltransferase involved in cell wall biosynthesis